MYKGSEGADYLVLWEEFVQRAWGRNVLSVHTGPVGETMREGFLGRR